MKPEVTEKFKGSRGPPQPKLLSCIAVKKTFHMSQCWLKIQFDDASGQLLGLICYCVNVIYIYMHYAIALPPPGRWLGDGQSRSPPYKIRSILLWYDLIFMAMQCIGWQGRWPGAGKAGSTTPPYLICPICVNCKYKYKYKYMYEKQETWQAR